MALVQIHLGKPLGLDKKSKIAKEVAEVICRHSDCSTETVKVIVWQNSPDAPEDTSVLVMCNGQAKQYPNSVCIY
jgi:phenylpyruvate tautomerase PptA (4-oxalocrotonate tautomerase family)